MVRSVCCGNKSHTVTKVGVCKRRSNQSGGCGCGNVYGNIGSSCSS